MKLNWEYVSFGIGQGLPGFVLLLPILAALFAYAKPKRELLSISPAAFGILVFLVSCLLASVPGIENSKVAVYFPLAGFMAASALIIPSIRAVRKRVVGALHLLTSIAFLYLWFVSSLLIAHDST